MKRSFAVLAILCAALSLKSLGSPILLLEQPYGRLGFFTATGHAAVYLSGVCAQTPLMLRRCAPGELGVVNAQLAAEGWTQVDSGGDVCIVAIKTSPFCDGMGGGWGS
jgi:hypothetical protein